MKLQGEGKLAIVYFNADRGRVMRVVLSNNII